MEKKTNLFENESPEVREQILQDTAYKVESDFSFTRPMTDEELLETREAFVQKSFEIQKLQEEFDRIKENFKMMMKPVKQDHSEILNSLKFKSVNRRETVYLLDNREEGCMSYYDKTGILITSRPFTSEENQLKMKVSKSGTYE